MITLRARGGAALREVHADFEVSTSADRTEASVRMRDLGSGSRKDVLFALDVPALAAPDVAWESLDCEVTYVDAGNSSAGACAACMVVERTPPCGSIASGGVDMVVETHRCRMLVATAMERAASLCGDGAPIADIQVCQEEVLVSHAPLTSGARLATRMARLRIMIRSHRRELPFVCSLGARSRCLPRRSPSLSIH